jgi:hypothetical protein
VGRVVVGRVLMGRVFFGESFDGASGPGTVNTPWKLFSNFLNVLRILYPSLFLFITRELLPSFRLRSIFKHKSHVFR